MDKKSFTIITKLKLKKNTKDSKCLDKIETVEEEVELIAKPLSPKAKKHKKINKIEADDIKAEENKNDQEINQQKSAVKQTVSSQSTENRFKYKMNLNLNFDFDKPVSNKNTALNSNNKKEETNKSALKSTSLLNDSPEHPKMSNEPLSSISLNIKKYSNPFSWKLSSPSNCIHPTLKKASNNLKRSRTVDSDEDDEQNNLDNENNVAKRPCV
jgi:hypothetical protein